MNFLLVKTRLFYIKKSSMKIKKCHTCKRKLPLFLYKINNAVYQRESDLGVCINCRFCGYKLALKQEGWMQRINGKFMFVKADKIDIFIKYWLKK